VPNATICAAANKEFVLSIFAGNYLSSAIFDLLRIAQKGINLSV